MNINYKERLGLFKHPLMGMTIGAWLRLLSRQGFIIGLRYWPKVIVMTLVILLNAPLQLLEFLIYSRRIKKQKVESPVFIIGHPRSGTTHLHYLLSKDERFAYCTIHQSILPHTFIIGGKLFKNIIARSLPSTRPQDEVKITIASPQEEEFAVAVMSGVSYMNSFFFPQNASKNFKEGVLFTNEKLKQRWQKSFKFFLQKLSYVNNGKQLLLKSPANLGRIKEILEVFPDAKFIHIHREPLEVFQSTVRLYEKVVPLTCFQETEDEKLEQFLIDAYRLMFLKKKKDINSLVVNKLVEIRYGDLLHQPLNELQKIYEAINLNSFEACKASFISELEKSKSYKRNSYPELDAQLKERLLEEWRDVLR